MKKLLLIILSLIVINTGSVYAEGNEIIFTPAGGGKFIYSNNPEELIREDLADDGETPEYLMNNQGLGRDKYRLYITHFNRVTRQVGDKTYPGESIWFDAVFVAEEDTVIEFSKRAFEIPENTKSYLNYETINSENPWSAHFVTATLLGETIYTLGTDRVFVPYKNNTYEVSLKAGDSFFLSSIMDNYEAVAYPKHVLMAADFEIKSGTCSVNVFAAKDRIADANGIIYPGVDFENCGFGIYKRGRTQKGIADSYPEVKTDLEFEINDSTKDGAYLPVTIKNQYYPKGNFVTEWVTNLNPQDDIYSKNLVEESNLLTLRYKDASKLDYYGENVPENERDDIWVFDTSHSDTMEYTEGVGCDKSEYSPNYLLDVNKNNAGLAVSVGNYGVTLRYNLKVTNNSSFDRYFEYNVSTGADIVVDVRDKEGKLLSPVISKGQSTEIKNAVMASVCLPAGETTEFSIGMMLPVQNYGGQRQSFRVSNKKSEQVFKKSEFVKPVDIMGVIEPDILSLIEGADDETKAVLSGVTDGLFAVKTDNGYAAYYDAVQGNPYLYGYYWQTTGKVFILDNDFNIVKELYLGSQPIEMSYANGEVYVKTIANGCFRIGEDLEAVPFEGYILPKSNGIATVFSKKADYMVDINGSGYYSVDFEKKPPYAEVSGDIFYYATEDGAGISRDGVNWTYITDKIGEIKVLSRESVLINGETVTADGRGELVILNDKILVPEAKLINVDGEVFVPARFILEKLGMRVLYDGKKKKVIAFGEKSSVEFANDNKEVYINGTPMTLNKPVFQADGTTYIPVSLIGYIDGFKAEYDEENMLSEITGKIGTMPWDIELDGELTILHEKKLPMNNISEN